MIWRKAARQKLSDDWLRNPVGADAARWKITSDKFVRGDEGEHPRIDPGPQRLNRIPYKRIATVFVTVQKADLQRQTKPPERSR